MQASVIVACCTTGGDCWQLGPIGAVRRRCAIATTEACSYTEPAPAPCGAVFEVIVRKISGRSGGGIGWGRVPPAHPTAVPSFEFAANVDLTNQRASHVSARQLNGQSRQQKLIRSHVIQATPRGCADPFCAFLLLRICLQPCKLNHLSESRAAG